MAQSTTTQADRPVTHVWQAGVVAGLVAGTGMGLVLQFGAGAMATIGALAGWPTAVGGWVVHLAVSVVLALAFAVVVSQPVFGDYTGSTASITGLGVGYGAGLGILTGGIAFPLWLNAATAADTTLAVPFLPVPGLVSEFALAATFAVAHLVYGALLGATYAMLGT